MRRRPESFKSWMLTLVIGGLVMWMLVTALKPRARDSTIPSAGEGGALGVGRGPGPWPARTPSLEATKPPESRQPAEVVGLQGDPAGRVAAEAKSKVEGSSPRLQLLVPAYFYPSGQGLDLWERLIRGAARAPIVIVANPASGPGEKPDLAYVGILRRASEQGITVVGYVNTGYAKRPIPEIQTEIEQWVRFYPTVRGIFFDMQASAAEHVEYYATLRKSAGEKIARAVVVTNPGTNCAEEYFSRPAIDYACVFESAEGFDQFHLPTWSNRYPPASFAALPYGIDGPEKMRDWIRLAVRGRIGSIYVTDAGAPDPWSRLPGYWEAEVDAVHRVNQRQEP